MKNQFVKIYFAMMLATFVFFGLSAFFGARAKESGDNGFLTATIKPFFDEVTDLEKIDESFELTDQFRDVEIKGVNGTIDIKASADGKTRLRFEGFAPKKEKERKFGYKVSEGKLSIKADDDSEGFEHVTRFFVYINDETIHSDKPILNIYLEVPPQELREIKAKSVNGQIKVVGLKLDELQMKTVDGDIEVRDLQSKDLSMKTVSGAITTERTKSAEVSINSVSGEVVLNVDAQKIDGKTVSGNIDIGLPANQKLDLTWKSVSGNVTNDYVSAKWAKDGKDSKYPGVVEATLKTVSGDLHIR